jgi:DNA-binding transcriptional LysR family regulator
MDIKKCKLFVITAETKQISKTAKLTGYTQSAVSHMLKSLEKEVGIELFKRDRYGVHLTSLGADFLFYVKRFLAENERLEQFVYDLHGLEVGSIRIGSYTSVSTAALPEIIKVFHESHPNVDIAIKEGGSDEMESWITDYEVDLGFCSKRPAFAFDFIHLIHDPMIAVLPPVYEVPVDMKSFPISEFNGKPFILSEEGIDYDINNILEKTKTHPDIILSAKDDATIISMVEHGVGLAILPELSCKGRPGNYKTMPLEPHYSRDLGIGVNSLNNATPITRSFIYAVQSYFDKANNQPLTAPV